MPLDRGLLDQQLDDLGEGSLWWDVREMRDLPTVLHADERILALGRGKIARGRWLRRTWLIAVTDQRLLCMHSERRPGWRQLEMSGRQIERARLRVGPFRGRVIVVAAGRKYRFLVRRAEGYKLLRALSYFDPPAYSLLPGFRPGRMVRQVLDHMMALPAVALGPDVATTNAAAAEAGRLQDRLDTLEQQNQHLQEQVDFLENLLREKNALPAAGRPE